MSAVRLLLLVCAAAGLPACARQDGEASAVDQSADAVHADDTSLRKSDFLLGINRSFLRSTSPTLSDSEFKDKYDASVHDGAFKFFRAYPGGYHEDLGQVDASRLPLAEGICFGDPHPGNFGFLHVDGKTKFGYNDLDDSGYCPVALDALRYFTSLQQMLESEHGSDVLFDEVLEQYVDTVKDPTREKDIPSSLAPDWKKENQKLLDNATRGKHLILDTDVVAASMQDVLGIITVIPVTVLDVARVLRAQGGSGGLARFYVLVERIDGTRTVLELKESVTPGVELGHHQRTLPASQRLQILKSAFWDTQSMEDNFNVVVNGARFLVRDRSLKSGIDIDTIDNPTREKVLLAQVSEMARVHRETWQGIDKDFIRSWLSDSSDTMAKRWDNTWSDAAH